MIKISLIVMAFTFFSRILGLIRTIFIASIFGASYTSDAYISAFKISNLFRQVLGEGALGTVFIPNYNEKIEKEGREKASSLIFSILFLLFIFLLIISSLSIIFSDGIINFIVKGYDLKTKILASKLLKISSIYFLFIGLAGMISAILNNYKKFIMPAFMPVMFNISIISCGILLYKDIGIYSVMIGLVLGGFLQLVVLLPQFYSQIKTYTVKLDFKDPYLKKIFIMMLPMLIGIIARQFNTVIDQYFASSLRTGTVSAMEYATRLYNLPLGVFGISIATVIYPSLSKSIERTNFKEVKLNIEKGLSFLMLLIIPSIFAMCFLADDIVKVTLSYGSFSKKAGLLTSQSLIFYSLGLYFYTAIHIISRAHYGMKDTIRPVIFSIISIFTNVVLNFVLVGKYMHIGLASATSIAAAVNFILLYISFNKNYIKLNLFKIMKFLFLSLISALIAILCSFYFDNSYIKIIVFLLIYSSLWIYPIIKKGVHLFD